MSKEEKVEGEGKELTNWEQRMAAEAKAVALVERPGMSTISLRSGIMSYMDAPVPDNKMNVVVINSCIEQSWYDQDFDADRIVPPYCFALGKPGEEQFLSPHEVVPEDQRQSDLCVNCEKFKWGSGRGKGKACGTRRRLVIIPASALLDPDSLQSSEMAVLKVPVTSVKNWSTYVNLVAAETQRPTWGVVTEVSVKPDPKTQFKVFFERKDVVDVSLLPKLEPLLRQSLTLTFTPFDMSQPAEEAEESGGKQKKY